MTKTLRVGLIGYKFMGKAHSNAWRQVNHFFQELPAKVELTAIGGRDAGAVESARGLFGWARAETDWRKIVTAPDIDIVDISTGNDTHCEMAVAALQAGKAVICEKPLARNLAEARQMLAAARRSRGVNMVCHNYRRIPAVALARQMIEAGELGGSIRHFHARYAQDWLVNPNVPLFWKLRKDLAGSGANGDINAHIVDLGRYLVGEFKEVCGVMETFIKERPLSEPDSSRPQRSVAAKKAKVNVDDAVSWIGRFENGALANMEATRFAPGRKNHIAFEINGDKGSLYFDFEDMNRLKFYNANSAAGRRGFTDIIVTEREEHPYARNWWPPGHIVGYEHTFVNTFAEFIQAVATNTPVHPSFLDGTRCMAVLEAVAESSAGRKWVRVPSVKGG
jgi:predicted dehydrogenase